MAERLGRAGDEIAAIELRALFHDVGMIGVPEHLLRKPAALDELKELRANARAQFNPVVVEAFSAAVSGERKSATQTKQIFRQGIAIS